MKKPFNILVMFLLFGNSLFAQKENEINVNTEASEVTIFSSGAQVIRKKQVELPVGKTLVRFTQLSPFLVRKSVLLKAYGDVTILTVNHQYNYLDSLKRVTEIRNLEEQAKALDKKIKLQTANLEVLKEQLLLLQENRSLKVNTQANSVNALREALEFYKEQISIIKNKEIETNQNIEELRIQKRSIAKQLQAIGATKHESYSEVTALVDSKKAQKLDFELSYFAQNATWFPSYDIRTDAINEPLRLVYKANIQQNTKEDWKNIKLKLSTSDPILGNVTTKLIPYELNYYLSAPRYSNVGGTVKGKVFDSETGEVIPGAVVSIDGTSIATITDENGLYTLSSPSSGNNTLTVKSIGYNSSSQKIISGDINFALEGEVSLNEVVVTAARQEKVIEGYLDTERSVESSTTTSYSSYKAKRKDESLLVGKSVIQTPTTVNFEIKVPYSFPSDKKLLIVEIDRIDIKANYEYYAAPKADKDAFLQASFTDWAQYNLLDGEASVYYENTYVGKSLLDISNASDTLILSLGRDRNVVISRESRKDYTTKQFLGTKREITKGWNITIRNNKNQPIKLILHDQVPVSQLAEIEVTVEETSGANFKKETGELIWNISLDPSQKKEILVKYKVKYPKNRKLSVE